MEDDQGDSGIEDNGHHSLHGDEPEEVPELPVPNFDFVNKIETVGDYLPETRSTPAAWLLEQMDDVRLEILKSYFFPNGPLQNRTQQSTRRVSYRGVGLTKEQFAKAVCEIIGTNVIWEAALDLHDRYARGTLDAFREGTHPASPRLLFWEQIVDAFLEEPAESKWSPLETPQTFHAEHLKREPIVRVIPLQTTKSFCYVVVSRWGRVGVYDAAFKLLESYRVKLGLAPLSAKTSTRQQRVGNSSHEDFTTGDVESTGDRRRGLPWINDVVFLPDALSIIFLCSDSSLQVWSAEWLVHSRKWTIMSVPSVLISAAYRPSQSKNLNGVNTAETQSQLFVGDEDGFVTTITFLQPRSSLFRPKDTENKKDEFFWAELRFQTDWVRVSSEQIHSCAVNELQYFSEGDVGVSVSHDSAASIVFFWPTERKAKTILMLSQGATCVTMSQSRRMIVAGCRDGSLQSWPFPPSVPPVTFPNDERIQVSEPAIRDVCFVNDSVLSINDKGVLKLWNIQTEQCIQELKLPVAKLKSQAISSLPHTPYRLFPGPARVSLLESAESHISTDSKELSVEYKNSVGNSNRATGTLSSATSDDLTDGAQSTTLDKYPVDIGVSCGTGVILIPFCPPPKPPPLLPLPTETPRVTVDGENKTTPPRVSVSQVYLRPPDRLPQPGYPSLLGTAGNQYRFDQTVSRPQIEDRVTEELSSAERKSLEALGVNREVYQQSLPSDLLQLLEAAQASVKNIAKTKLNGSTNQTLVCKSSEMKRLVKECAPHLALRLTPEVPITFSRTLPMSTRMRTRKLDLSEPKRLIATKLPMSKHHEEDTGVSSSLSPLKALAHAADSYMVGTADFLRSRESYEEAFDRLCRTLRNKVAPSNNSEAPTKLSGAGMPDFTTSESSNANIF